MAGVIYIASLILIPLIRFIIGRIIKEKIKHSLIITAIYVIFPIFFSYNGLNLSGWLDLLLLIIAGIVLKAIEATTLKNIHEILKKKYPKNLTNIESDKKKDISLGKYRKIILFNSKKLPDDELIKKLILKYRLAIAFFIAVIIYLILKFLLYTGFFYFI